MNRELPILSPRLPLLKNLGQNLLNTQNQRKLGVKSTQLKRNLKAVTQYENLRNKIKVINQMNNMFKQSEIKKTEFSFKEVKFEIVDEQNMKEMLNKLHTYFDKTNQMMNHDQLTKDNKKLDIFVKKMQNLTQQNKKINSLYKDQNINKLKDEKDDYEELNPTKKIKIQKYIEKTDEEIDNDDLSNLEEDNKKTKKQNYISDPNSERFKEEEDIDEVGRKFRFGWQDDYPKHTQDLRSDEKKNSKKQFKEREKNENNTKNFFLKDGDGSTLNGQLKSDENFEADTKRTKKDIDTWNKSINNSLKYLSINDKSLNEHEPFIQPLLKDYLELGLFALVAIKQANKEIKMVEKHLFLLEDKYLGLFKYVNIEQIIDITQGVSVPLPDQWLVMNPVQSSETISTFKVTKQEVSPHLSAIKLETDPINTYNDQGVILVSRQHKTYDGSFHQSMQIPDKKSIMGSFFRFSDQFTNYSIKFVTQEKLMFVQLNSPFGFKIIHTEAADQLNPNTWIRVVIDFHKYKIRISIHPELTTADEELNEDQRKLELSQEFTNVQDPGLKEGKVGFFCTDCRNIAFASIQLWSDNCELKSSQSTAYKIMSIYNPRYVETFKPPRFEAKFKSQTYKDGNVTGEFTIGPDSSVKNAILTKKSANSKRYYKAAATLAIYKDNSLTCFNKCLFDIKARMTDDKQGNMVIGFKFKNAFDQYALVFSKEKKKCQIRLVQVGKKVNVLTAENYAIDKVKFETYQDIKMKFVNDNITVTINNKAIFKSFSAQDFNSKFGTQAFGVNNSEAAFTEIKMSAMLPDEYFKRLEREALKNKKPEGVPMQGDNGSDEPYELEKFEDEAQVEEAVDYKCLKNDSKQARMGWCGQQFNTQKHIESCTNSFCSICCLEYSKEVKVCEDTCNAKTKQENVIVVVAFAKCFEQPDGENNIVKNNQCKECCDNSKTIQIPATAVEACQNECQSRFSKVEGVSGVGAQSLLNGDES